MCKIGGGANRCDAHWGPAQKAADLAKRRAKYAASKGGNIRFYSKKENTEETPKLVPAIYDTTTSRVNSFLRDELIKYTSDEAVENRHDIVSKQIEGEYVDKGLLAAAQVEGPVNWKELDENSYKEFGFQPIEELRDSKDLKLTELVKMSQMELNDLTYEEKNAVSLFTSDDYVWINDALFGVRTSEGYPMNNVEPDNVKLVDFSDPSSGESINSSYKTPANLQHITDTIDSAFSKAPNVQRIVHRGIRRYHLKTNDLHKYVETNFQLGQEMVFDGYQSASYNPTIAASYSMVGYSHEDHIGIHLEIKTSSGLNISSISNYEDEYEVLLPRDARYMVVGVHKDSDYRVVGPGDSKNSEGKNGYVIQLVEINDKGEIPGEHFDSSSPAPLTDKQLEARKKEDPKRY